MIGAILVALWPSGIVAAPRAHGYFSPMFSPDGISVIAIARDVLATKVGFGHQCFTPPVTVRLHRDRFKLKRVAR